VNHYWRSSLFRTPIPDAFVNLQNARYGRYPDYANRQLHGYEYTSIDCDVRATVEYEKAMIRDNVIAIVLTTY
jgi:hypothetical protein